MNLDPENNVDRTEGTLWYLRTQKYPIPLRPPECRTMQDAYSDPKSVPLEEPDWKGEGQKGLQQEPERLDVLWTSRASKQNAHHTYSNSPRNLPSRCGQLACSLVIRTLSLMCLEVVKESHSNRPQISRIPAISDSCPNYSP